MATFYLDFEGGNDANDGTTFANRWKSLTSGATAARIAPGDTIRIMGSPAPTSLGQNGVWTSQALQATKNITGATNATPISITCTGHGYSTGDTVVITGVGGNTNANGTWEITSTGTNTFTLDGSAGNAAYTSGGTVRLRNNTRVMLTTAVTQNIASTGPGRTAWTTADATNVSCNLATANTKEHQSSDFINIGAGFTTGKAAYYTLPATLDLSGYQQVSFWIYQNTGTASASGVLDLRLCSDTLGATAVNTISIPSIAAIGRWVPVTVDLGTSLGNSIASVALYVNTDSGVLPILLSNIIACKASSAADSLTLTSLIGKNTTGETFWGIQSINGRRVMLDADTNANPTSTSVRGYYGTSETVTTWKRETIKLGPAASASTALQTIQDSGTDGSPITFSGGWDRTNMSTQSLETWLDGQNGNGYGITDQSTARSWVTYDKLSFRRFAVGFILQAAATRGVALMGADFGNCTNQGVTVPHVLANVFIKSSAANGGNGASMQGAGYGSTIEILNASSNGSNGFICSGLGNKYKGTQANNNDVSGFDIGGSQGLIIADVSAAGNGVASVRNSQLAQFTYLSNCLLGDATEIDFGSTPNSAIIQSHNHDQTPGNHKIFMNGAMITAATDQRHTASGISWKIQPTSTNRSSSWPVTLSLVKRACSANNLVTIKAWMRRDNSGLTMRLVCKGGQIAGVTNDVTASVTTTNTWEELTITFTPTEIGVVEITAEAWGGTTYSGWVDDLTISQA